MKKYTIKKPGTTNVLMIMISIILVSGAFAYSEYRNNEEEVVYIKDSLTASTSTDLISQNPENSSDWKKVLLANINTSSTTSKTSTSTTKDLTKKTEVLTQTDLLARDFFSKYMELKKEGLSDDPTSQQDLANNTLNNITLVTPKLYKISQIKIKSDVSKDAIKQYGNEVGFALNKYTINSRSEIVIAKESLEKEDPELLKELDPIISSHKSLLNALLKVSPPQSIAYTHLDFINAVNSALFITESLRNASIDPISGLQAINQYQATANSLADSFSAIRSYIASTDIAYSQNDNGYIFIK